MADNEDQVPCVVLPDGTKIFPDGTVEEVGQLSQEQKLANFEQKRLTVSAKTSIADLPVDGKTATVYVAIITYELIGFSHADIAFLLHTDIAHISEVVKLNDFRTMKELVISKLFEAEKSDARAILAQSAPFAAAKVVNTMREKGALGYMAAKDVLALNKINEAPKENAMHTLEIVVVKKEEADKRSVDKIAVTLNGG